MSDDANGETPMPDDQKIIEALQSAQAALNPLSGFLRKGNAIDRRHLETVRVQIDAALTKMTTYLHGARTDLQPSAN